jgi:hypothetical protein
MTTPSQRLAGLLVQINFNDGFQIPFTLDDSRYGLLDSGILAGSAPIVDYTARTTNINIRRGRDVLQDGYNAGQATIRILDPNGDFNPQNIDSPIFGYVTTNKILRISHNGIKPTGGVLRARYLFTGYISDYRYTFPQGQETGYVTITAFDAFKFFNTSAITTVTGAAAGDKTGTRIGQILTQIGWPSGMMRSINTGQVECENDNGTSRSALVAIRLAEISENGAFFIDPQGTAVFQNRARVYSEDGLEEFDFSNDQFVSYGQPYQNIKFAFDDKRVYNSATITREGGSPQTYSDATSIAKYFLHSYTQSGLIMRHNADALLLAEGYIEARKDNDIRIDAITIDFLTSGAAEFIDYLEAVYFDIFNITNVTQEGSLIQKTLQCQGMNHEITPTSWLTTYTTLDKLIVSQYWV